VVDGNPAISYFDSTGSVLKYAYSSTPAAADPGDWTSITVDSVGAVGNYSSLAVVNGNPAISYYDATNGDLKYAYSATPDGASPADWTSLTVTGLGGDVGHYTSLALIAGKPAISYYDVALGNLLYAYSSQADGSSGWSTLAVESGLDDVGRHTSLAFVNGCPAVSYFDATTAELHYAHSSVADGSSGWTWLTVDAAGDGLATSLAVVDGCPAIAYHGSGLDLRYAASAEADGSSGWSALTVDSGSDLGSYPALALVSGRPAISYLDAENGNLKFAYDY
jgi:hypothetical protein